jgi:hypothetical protein
MAAEQPSLPPFNHHGYLPEGVHDTTVEELYARFVFNEPRQALWERLESFHQWAVSTGSFSYAYIGGGFTTNKAQPEDIDVILQTLAGYGPQAFAAMEPFFAMGIDTIFTRYSVHLHFWCEGFPSGLKDFRRFFQYLRPQEAAGLKEGTKKGIARIRL